MLENTFIYRFLIGNTDLEEYKRVLPYALEQFTPIVTLLMLLPPLTMIPLAFFLSVFVLILYGTYTVFFTRTCTLIMDDFVTWSEVIHHTALVYLAVFINLCLHMSKSNLVSVVSQHMNGLFHYEEGLVDPSYKKLKEENKTQIKKMFMVPVLIIIVTITALLVKPIMDYINDVPPHPALVENNITLKSLVPIKYPRRVEDPYEALAMNFLLLIFALFVVSTIVGADIIFIRISSFIALELSILNESVRLIEKRAKRMYIRRHGLKPPTKNKQDSPLYQNCIEDCLRENIQHHLQIKILFNDFSAIASPAIGGGFFTCSIVMGLGMIIMNMDDVSVSDQIAFTGIVLAELLNAFMISWNSELIGELNYELYMAVYGVRWWNWSRRNKSTIITFLDGTREPLFLNAFGLTTINMETFGLVVNRAYSLLNLMAASESMEGDKK